MSEAMKEMQKCLTPGCRTLCRGAYCIACEYIRTGSIGSSPTHPRINRGVVPMRRRSWREKVAIPLLCIVSCLIVVFCAFGAVHAWKVLTR